MHPSPPGTVYLWPGLRRQLFVDLANAPTIHTGEWQAMNTSGSKLHTTHEMEDVTIVVPRVPAYNADRVIPPLKTLIPADYDWAEEHFAERVSGIPHNPAPSHVRWPYAVAGNMAHMSSGPVKWGDEYSPIGKLQFDHTYPERFWPKYVQTGVAGVGNGPDWAPMSGIRFNYGDLDDVVALLVRSPMTRQAYLPVWFPEDTGAREQQRVPCTLGYHFMIRNGKMSMRYYMRSCDIYRHLDNDIYLACRLLQWMVDSVNEGAIQAWPKQQLPDSGPIKPGRVVMHIASLHMFTPDVSKMAKKVQL